MLWLINNLTRPVEICIGETLSISYNRSGSECTYSRACTKKHILFYDYERFTGHNPNLSGEFSFIKFKIVVNVGMV